MNKDCTKVFIAGQAGFCRPEKAHRRGSSEVDPAHLPAGHLAVVAHVGCAQRQPVRSGAGGRRQQQAEVGGSLFLFFLMLTSGVFGGSSTDGCRPWSSPQRHGGSARYPFSSYMPALELTPVPLP